MGVRIADPRPAFCSACFNSDTERKFVDFEAAWDGPVVLDKETGVAILSEGGAASSTDDLFLCESCVREACELIGMKPELNSRQRNEIRRLELANEHWRSYAKNLEQTLAERPERAPGAPKRAVAA